MRIKNGREPRIHFRLCKLIRIKTFTSGVVHIWLVVGRSVDRSIGQMVYEKERYKIQSVCVYSWATITQIISYRLHIDYTMYYWGMLTLCLCKKTIELFFSISTLDCKHFINCHYNQLEFYFQVFGSALYSAICHLSNGHVCR